MPEDNLPEQNIPELDRIIGKPGDVVPTVDPADIRSLWNYYQELNARHPGAAISIRVIEHVCSPGADTRAVAYRCAMLGMLPGMLELAWPGELSESAFKVAARIELKWLPVGVPQKGFPFDLEGFIAEVQEESMFGGAKAR